MASSKKVNFVGVSSRELPATNAFSTSVPAQSGRTTPSEKRRSALNPLEDLTQRLSVWDPNLPDFSAIFGRFNNDGYANMEKTLNSEPTVTESTVIGLGGKRVAEDEENSPYEEVRVVVRPYDEDLPCSTIRAWVLGIILVFVGSAVNTIFSMRNPTISLSSLVAQLVAYPAGCLWYKIVPSHVFTTFGHKWSFNPGPFNVKEHTLIVVMANVAYSIAYATDILLAQIKFYNQNFGILWQILLMITTQVIGYGIAGIQRRFLVYPASMIWPTILPQVTLMYTLHETELPKDPTVLGGNMSRYKWFFIVTGCAFVWYWVPGFLFQALSIFAFMTFIYPNNPVINQLFGGASGLSLIPLTLDWTTVTGFVGSPLVVPWHAIANVLIGVFVFYIVMASGIHYSGAFFSLFLPMSDSAAYDNTGTSYNTTKLVTPQLTLNEKAYKAYSPLFLSTTFTISYGLSFAAISALIVHTYLYHGKEIIGRIKQWKDVQAEDVHMKLMRKYKEVPEWWYGVLFLAMFVLSIVTITVYQTNFAWWAFILAIIISMVFALPIGMIQASTGISIGLNVLTEFVFGYIQPGRPLGLMLFKTFGYITMAQGLGFVQDLKL
ncbi:MAG: hypothetical protein Q9227_002967 [Pyrenula ochraceoflavens]